MAIVNATLARTPEMDKTIDSIGTGKLPNGIIKTKIAVYDDLDPNIGIFTFRQECFDHNRSFNGNRF